MILEIDFLGVQKPVNFEKIAKKIRTTMSGALKPYILLFA